MLLCGAGCCLFACGPTGVGGAARAVLWTGLLGVPVGGGPPASRPRRELRSARRLEARPGPAVPPAPSTPVAVGVLHYMKPSGSVSPACRTLV